jgi:hypothetical protein
VTHPTPRPLTPRETQLAEALVCLVDYAGRVLLTALDGTSPHYMREKAGGLAEAANRVAGLLDADGDHADRPTTIRLPAVARAVATWSQHHTAGRLLFPRPHLRADDTPGRRTRDDAPGRPR